jgi:peptide/nickel transport system ATP-binding protein/glutathione transport system ATP-binding protein
MTPTLTVENLSLAFGAHPAVKGLSFTVGRGETVALVGESGSGKSATALAILRLIEREGGRIAGGRILLHGAPDTDLTAAPPAVLRTLRGNRVAMIFQEPMTALNPVMRLGEQVAEVLRLHRGLSAAQARAEAIAAFARVRIPDPERRASQYPHELSGGLRQRVMIAMALACRPDLLIADEPTTALDVTTQAEILRLIRELQAEAGMSLLFITHDMGVVAEIADRVVVLRQGEKVEEGPADTLFARPAADYTRVLVAASPRLGSGAPKAPVAAPPVLEVRDLAVRFPVGGAVFPGRGRAYHAVNSVSLTVGRGETLGLVGESGCGKSTLARAVLRLIEPAEGEVLLQGKPILGLPPAALRALRAEAQMVFQDPFASLNPRMAVRDLITEPARIAGHICQQDTRDLAVDLLAKVGLEPAAADRFAHQFSGGQRQRLCIARALSVQPALIVADEPVSALDVSVARQVTDLMAELQAREGVAFLFISHDMAVVERVSHRIAVMQAGRIVETGPTAQVLAHPAHPYTRRLLAAVPVPDPARRHRLRAVLPPLAEPPALLLPQGELPPRGRMAEVAPGHWVLADSDPVFRFAAALAGAGAQGSGAVARLERETAGSVQP